MSASYGIGVYIVGFNDLDVEIRNIYGMKSSK